MACVDTSGEPNDDMLLVPRDETDLLAWPELMSVEELEGQLLVSLSAFGLHAFGTSTPTKLGGIAR